MYAQIEIGGPVSLRLLGELFELATDANVWVPIHSLMVRDVRDKTFMGKRRMLGDLNHGPEDEVLEVCDLVGWFDYAVWAFQQKQPLSLQATDTRFDDDEFSGRLQSMQVDYRIQLPGDSANSCDPLIIRPGEKHARTLYASDYEDEPRYTLSEVLGFLSDPGKWRERLELDGRSVKPLIII